VFCHTARLRNHPARLKLVLSDSARAHWRCWLCLGNNPISQRSNPAAGIDRNSGAGQCIQAKRSRSLEKL